MTLNVWWRTRDGDVRGPAALADLPALVRDAELGPDTPVGLAPDGPWSPLGERVPRLFAPPPRGLGAWTNTEPRPWPRFFARMFDVITVAPLAWLAVGAAWTLGSPDGAAAAFALFEGIEGEWLRGMLTLALMVPINAAMIGATGLTPGKWVFGVRVLRDGAPLGFGRALRREAQVYLQGFALGAPLLYLAALALGHRTLLKYEITDWDRDAGNTVHQRPAGRVQGLLATLGGCVVVGCALWIQMRP